MKIRPVGTKLFHADRRTDVETGGHDVETGGHDESNVSKSCERSLKSPKIVHHFIFRPITVAAGNKFRINLQVISNNYYSVRRLYLFMNPPFPIFSAEVLRIEMHSHVPFLFSFSLHLLPTCNIVTANQFRASRVCSSEEAPLLLLYFPLSLALTPLRITCTSFGWSNL